MNKIKIDRSKIDRAIKSAFDSLVEVQSQAFDEAIIDERWSWPNETIRKNGETASSPRSIVDTGELLDSKVITRDSSANAAEFSWEAEHALWVLMGYTTVTGEEMPGRDWTEPAIADCSPKEVFERALKQNL